MFVVKVHGVFGVRDNRRGLLWPGSQCQNNETAKSNVLVGEENLIFCRLQCTLVKFTKLVYYTVPKLSGVIYVGH